jgi:ribosome biogenesis protein BRX1
MDELKLTGNSLKGSRPILSFDKLFEETPHYSLLRELFTQVFSTPCYHPKSKPFIDHIFNFSIFDNRIWFRNYQIVEEDTSLVEIGPRFVLNLVKIFEGSFGGTCLYDNPHYCSPNQHRRLLKRQAGMKFQNRVDAKTALAVRKGTMELPEDELEQVFQQEN